MGIAPTYIPFAEECLTTWLPGHVHNLTIPQEFVNFLAILFSAVYFYFQEGDCFNIDVFLDVFPELSALSSGEVERRGFFALRQDGDKNCSPPEVRRAIRAGDGDKRSFVGFSLQELSGEFFDNVGDFFSSVFHHLKNKKHFVFYFSFLSYHEGFQHISRRDF